MLKTNNFRNITQARSVKRNKVTIIGSGVVGTAVSFAIATLQVANDVFVWNRNEDKVQGEILDLQSGLGFLSNVKVFGGSDLSFSANSKVVIIAAGARKVEGESTKDLTQRNIDIVGKLISKIVQFSPDCVMLILTSPSDIISFAVWKLSGFPKHRIIGVGNHLHSMMLRSQIASKLDVNVSAVNALVLGEQNEQSIPVENVNVNGIDLQDCDGILMDTRRGVMKNFEEIHNLKGCVQWSIALCCTDIIKAIVNDSNEIKIVSTMIKGLFGVSKEVFMSVPCVINRSGVSAILDVKLNEHEEAKIRESAYLLDEIQKLVNY